MKHRLLAALGFVLTAIGLAVTAGGAYAYFWDQARADVIGAGVRVDGVPVGGLRTAQAAALLESRIVAPLRRPLRIDAGAWSTTIERTSVHVDVAGMVAQALAATRQDPLDRRLLRRLRGEEIGVSVPLQARVSPAGVSRTVALVSAAVDRAATPAHVVPSATRLRIVPSTDGVAVDTTRFAAQLRRALLDPDTSSLSVPTHVVHPSVTTAQLAKRYPSFLVVDREHFKLRLFRHLKLAKVFPVSVGRAGLETPAGLYHIDDRQTNPSWHVPLSSWAGSLAGKVIPPGPADPIKARWLGFYDGAGIHGTDETYSIGHAASHGCVRMRIPDVIALYPLVPLGTPIYVG
ncbi:MAG TPA: L,D-transpeptidase family protein [Gaiellaceae bacterium]|nr:L,D-transpeptidase family protein [Gaiellaceae bacterium]